ncbi:MAG: type I-E CRISPR-associated endonuclease Cas1 [Anaerolineae bacterium]|nr:type I-E CRISPR-associated endonuclease Cas1 [Anaerolineae bacterium]
MRDLQELPKLADSLTYLYTEHAVIEQKRQGIELFDKDGATLVPTASLTVLLLGPGTSITHAAVKALADSGCAIVWVGEDGTRCYAQGGGETRKAYHLLHQARLASDPVQRLEVCKRMYRMRFQKQNLDPFLSIEQLRGMEGARVRDAYAHASITYNVPWNGRNYDRAHWGSGDPVNRALSAANALLNGLCHAAIVSGGYSPALGFIHTGKQLSFVYDVADLYKVEVTIPTAFQIAGESRERVEPRVREACRQAFKKARLLQRILPDIENLLAISQETLTAGAEADEDPARPEPLWTPAAEVEADVSGSPAEPLPANRQPADDPETLAAIASRRRRAEEGLRGGWEIRQTADAEWRVVTHPGKPGYTVEQIAGAYRCNCPDFGKSALGCCKHTLAVEITNHES